MARTNYSFAKRQREIAKKKKKEEKRLRKQAGDTDIISADVASGDAEPEAAAPAETGEEPPAE